MKIEKRITLSNVFNIGLIILVGLFALENLNLILTKLRFVEIADDLNASFLEMRLSEKNYFLYHDETALFEIKEKIDGTLLSINLVHRDIVKAIGEPNIETLRTYLMNYAAVVDEIRRGEREDPRLDMKFRTEGKKLREFSNTITKLERRGVNNIITTSKNVLFLSFGVIVITAVVVSHFISQQIVRSLRKIENLARTISLGNFRTIEGQIPSDEFGSLMTAINSMSEELRNREEELIQSKKLASLGILTAGVAHELTNPLNNISMIAQNFIEYHDILGKEKRIEMMDKVDAEAKRIEEIVKNLLDFSKPKEGNFAETDINETIQKALPLVQNMLDISNIDLKLSLELGVPHVFIDAHQIQQVLVNLIVNAVQAMASGGALYISTYDDAAAGAVRVDIRDTGKGIPAEYLPHLFDPFFSTKGVSGTGLGLSVSYGIIKNHKGNIKVESELGKGTTFSLELPAYTGVHREKPLKT
jgi:two-component system NtrC family sensor kinase